LTFAEAALFYVFGWCFLALSLAGAAYATVAAIVAGNILRQCAASESQFPAITILRPLHGSRAGLETALRSVLLQTYSGPVQLVLGLADAADPARSTVEALKQSFLSADIAIVVDPHVYGANRKISNLINMTAAAKHDLLILSDADIEVPPNWLSRVVEALSQPGAGAVSCFYSGVGSGPWARLAAMGISYQFLPNAVVGAVTGLAHPCFGSTIALTRQTLDEIGGFERFANSLADDYEIGRAMRATGHKLVYPPLLVKHQCAERSFGELWNHELRWARTIRTIDPLGHFGSAVTYAVPLGLIGTVLLGFSLSSLFVLATVVAARLFLKYRIDHIAGAATGPAWLLPPRDVLSFAVFLASLFGGTVNWSGDRLHIGKGGAISQGE
jgi:ceramide glucosyltransferase